MNNNAYKREFHQMDNRSGSSRSPLSNLFVCAPVISKFDVLRVFDHLPPKLTNFLMTSSLWYENVMPILEKKNRPYVSKVYSVNFDPPEFDLCSSCHVYPRSREAWITSVPLTLNIFTWELNYII